VESNLSESMMETVIALHNTQWGSPMNSSFTGSPGSLSAFVPGVTLLEVTEGLQDPQKQRAAMKYLAAVTDPWSVGPERAESMRAQAFLAQCHRLVAVGTSCLDNHPIEAVAVLRNLTEGDYTVPTVHCESVITLARIHRISFALSTLLSQSTPPPISNTHQHMINT